MIHHQHPLTSSCLGTQRQLSSFHFGQPGSPAGKAYIQASLHADELPGMLTAWELKQALQVLEQEGKLPVKSFWCRKPTRLAMPSRCWVISWAVSNWPADRTSTAITRS
jgi:predicted deacylase